MAVDDDTKKYLEEVKKGKPRRFAMIMKGEKIINLIVYKKGTVEKYKKQAKEEGQGQFYFGVVDGKGQDICFKLSVADGFDAVPGKDIKLKAYLSDEAEMKFKPTYAVVPDLPDVDEDEEGPQEVEGVSATSGETIPPQSPPQPTPPTQPPPTSQLPPESPPSPPTDNAEEFTNRLRSLVPDLKRAHAAQTPLGEQLSKLTALAQTLGKEKRYTDGLKVLDKLEGLIKQALSLPPTAPPVTPGSADPTAFTNRLKSLMPSLKEVLAANTSFSDRLRELSAKAQALGKEKKFDQGVLALEGLEKLIQRAHAEASTAEVVDTGEPGNPLEIWREVKERVDMQISSLQAALRGFNDPDLERIAEYGMYGLTDGLQVKLQTAIFDLSIATQPAARDKIKAKAVQIVSAYEKMIAGSEIVTLCDENPFDIAVNIRQTLMPELKRMRQSIQAA
jgi:hypothetical protein